MYTILARGMVKVVVMGVSGSGKTTVGQALAEHLQLQFYDGDDFHSPGNKDKMAHGQPLTDLDRKPWLEMLAELVGGTDCVLACSCLKRKYRMTMIKDMPDKKDLLFVYLKGSKDVIEKRLTKRQGHYFKADLLQSQFDALEEPEEDENVLTVQCDASVNTILEVFRQFLESD